MKTSRHLLFFLAFVTCTASATDITLKRDERYTVPEGKVWLIDNAPPAPCKVCTADIYVDGKINNVEINGVVFSGNFDFSFSKLTHGTIKLHAGTEFWLGDSRQQLAIQEMDDEH